MRATENGDCVSGYLILEMLLFIPKFLSKYLHLHLRPIVRLFTVVICRTPIFSGLLILGVPSHTPMSYRTSCRC